MTTAGSADVPVPLNAFDPFTVPKILIVAFNAPTLDEVKTKFTMQDELAAMLPPFAQVFPTVVA